MAIGEALASSVDRHDVGYYYDRGYYGPIVTYPQVYDGYSRNGYAAAQVAGHQQTLDTLKGYAATRDVAELKTFAHGLAATVAAHLNITKSVKS